jgi:hypothetical protein
LLKSNQNKADFQAAIQQAKKFEELENLMKRICSLSDKPGEPFSINVRFYKDT